MKTIVLSVLVMFLFGARVAVAQDVRYDFDKDKNFTQYKTYKWVAMKGGDALDDLTAKQIAAAIDAELATKGLMRTDADTADLYIGYQTALDSEKEYSSYTTGWDYGPGWGRGWYGYGGASTGSTYGSTSTIYIGQLDLSMFDSTRKQLVWRGTASKTLDPKARRGPRYFPIS